MQEAFIDVGGVPTHIMTWGKWIEESFTNEKEIVLCIPGNPGLPAFYTQFLSTVHQQCGKELPVWILGHAGHDEPSKSSLKKIPPLKGNEDKYSLNGQILHKIEFIRRYVPKDVKIHLIGHSIGSHCILEMLKIPEIKQQVKHCYMLFPTFERMAVTRNGYFLTKLLPFMRFFIWIYVAFHWLPEFLKIWVLYVYFYVTSIPNTFLGSALIYTRATVTEKVTKMASDEMEFVLERDNDLLLANVDILTFYYGTSDGWVPVRYYKQLKQAIPNVNAMLDENEICHAFVLKSSVEMGNIVADWINKKRGA